MNRLLAAICDALPHSFEEATPHELPNAIAIYGALTVLVIVPLVILLRKARYRRQAWWVEKFNFRQAKAKENEHRRY